MDIIDRIERLQSYYGDLNFTDKLELTECQRFFVDLEDDSRIIDYELLSERCVGRTYSMLLKAIKIGMNKPGNYSIGIFSRTSNSAKIAKNQAMSILEDNNLTKYIKNTFHDFIEFDNGVRIRFLSYSNENTIRGIKLKYAFVDDWVRYRRDARNASDFIASTTFNADDGQAFFMCTN